MIPMFAEVLKNGQWHKVGKIFTSALPELEGQLTDRVYDGSNKVLDDILSEKTTVEGLDIHKGVIRDMSKEIATHRSLVGRKVCFVYASNLLASLCQYSFCKTGYITEWQYKRLINDNIQPVHIRHNVPQSTGVKVSPMEMDMILSNSSLRRDDVKYFVKYEYDRCSFNQDCPFFFNKTVPVLSKLYSNNEEVRVVYGIKE